MYVANVVANNVLELPFTGGAAVVLGSGAFGAASRSGSTLQAASMWRTPGTAVSSSFPNENGKLNTADQLTVASGLRAPAGLAVANSGLLTVADSTASAIYSYTRTAAATSFGNVPAGTQATGVADLISAGNAPVIFANPYFTAAGNTADFSLTPAHPHQRHQLRFRPGLWLDHRLQTDRNRQSQRGVYLCPNQHSRAHPYPQRNRHHASRLDEHDRDGDPG